MNLQAKWQFDMLLQGVNSKKTTPWGLLIIIGQFLSTRSLNFAARGGGRGETRNIDHFFIILFLKFKFQLYDHLIFFFDHRPIVFLFTIFG